MAVAVAVAAYSRRSRNIHKPVSIASAFPGSANDITASMTTEALRLWGRRLIRTIGAGGTSRPRGRRATQDGTRCAVSARLHRAAFAGLPYDRYGLRGVRDRASPVFRRGAFARQVVKELSRSRGAPGRSLRLGGAAADPFTAERSR